MIETRPAPGLTHRSTFTSFGEAPADRIKRPHANVESFETAHGKRTGIVRSWASILDAQTKAQAEMISRAAVVSAPVALMPDAHLGVGACVGSAIVTHGGIIPAAVGVDMGCGVIAVQTDLRREALKGSERSVLGRIRETIPAGVGQGHTGTGQDWAKFHAEFGDAPGGNDQIRAKSPEQFGTLGSGNHFAEVCQDEVGSVWLLVHSGSRGPGNMLADKHIKKARELCAGAGVEHADLSHLTSGTDSFDAYIADMRWAQAYAFHQRQSMMNRMVEAIAVHAKFSVARTINCHHNYSVEIGAGQWLSRKGAIAAEADVLGIVPGSMGAATHIVRGKGNIDAHCTAPHGAGRRLGRNQARKSLSVDEFKAKMGDRTWQDRDADNLLDEAPDVYKPIDVVMRDAEPLVESTAVLSQFINFKGM